MCTLHDFSVLKSNLFIRALLLDRILVTEKTTRTPRVHLVIIEGKQPQLSASTNYLSINTHECTTVVLKTLLCYVVLHRGYR